MSNQRIFRRFVETSHGDVHLLENGAPDGGGVPLVLLHPSARSSKVLRPLATILGEQRKVIAPDTLGNGDSSAPSIPDPGIDHFAAAHLEALTAMGVGEFDLYGTHTGSSIAIEMATRHPDRVRSLVLDGVSLYDETEKAQMLARYAPALQPDLYGQYAALAWHVVRDNYLFWPWFLPERQAARTVGLPPARVLHERYVDIMKSVETYHLSYRAAIAYPKEERFGLIQCPVMVTCARNDVLFEYFDRVRAFLPDAQFEITPGIDTNANTRETARTVERFLRARDRRPRQYGTSP